MAVKKKKTPKKKAGKTKKKAIKKAVKRLVKKKIIKKPLKKAAKKKKPVPKKPAAKKNLIGLVTHYFPHVRAAVIKLKAPLAVGDTIKIKGHTTDFTQTITSLQIDRVAVNSAKNGQEIGLLVNSRVRQHDEVTKV